MNISNLLALKNKEKNYYLPITTTWISLNIWANEYLTMQTTEIMDILQ